MNYNGLKVAFLHPRLEGGGAERVSLTTAKLFSKWGIHSTFVGAKHNANEFILPEGISAQIYCLPNQESFYTEDNKAALISYIADQDIRIAFACYMEGEFFEQWSKHSSCKFVYWNHSKPFWEVNYKAELQKLQATYSIKKRMLNYLQRVCSMSIRSGGGEFAYTQYVRECLLRDIRLFERYIVLCPEYKTEISRDLPITESERVKLVSMTNTIEIEADVNLNKNKEIIYVGRLSLAPKRFDRLLKVWREIQDKLPDWELKFYGAGPDEWIFHKLVKKYKLRRVRLYGYETDLKRIYNDAAIVCLTSTFEGWGMVLAEGQNNGVIPVVFDCCAGVNIIVGDNQCAGRLVKPFDLRAYADTLLELCTNEELRKSLQQACLSKRLDYAPNVNDDRWRCLLDELIEGDDKCLRL
ncbi:MAG: glycosyltransferase [Porphyromonadaceae bacterium]|nr:glycosyltransferase [Porphyromonadaceae bacterium]